LAVVPRNDALREPSNMEPVLVEQVGGEVRPGTAFMYTEQELVVRDTFFPSLFFLLAVAL
jgi:hypothetical protein